MTDIRQARGRPIMAATPDGADTTSPARALLKDVRDPAVLTRDARLDSINARNTAPLALVRAAFDPARLEADAAAFDRAADALQRLGPPGGDVVENDPAYRRGILYGHMLDVVRLRELARARRAMIREMDGKRWEANAPTDPAA